MTVQVTLRASRSEVWAATSTVGDMNREIGPLGRMTDPTHGAPFDAEPWRSGALVIWQLFLGVIPIDRHRIELVALPDGSGFRESSSTWWYRVWRHERTLLDDPDGCVVRDSVEIESRFGMPAPIIERAVGTMFRHRYRRLQRRFG